MKTITLDVPEYGFVNNGKGIDEAINEIISKYNVLENYNKSLRKQNEELKSEHYKDEELKRLKEKNNELNDAVLRGFSLTKSEHKSILKWQEEHICKYRNSKFNGIDSYRFDIISGIGYNGYVRCNCGSEFCFHTE